MARCAHRWYIKTRAPLAYRSVTHWEPPPLETHKHDKVDCVLSSGVQCGCSPKPTRRRTCPSPSSMVPQKGPRRLLRREDSCVRCWGRQHSLIPHPYSYPQRGARRNLHQLPSQNSSRRQKTDRRMETRHRREGSLRQRLLLIQPPYQECQRTCWSPCLVRIHRLLISCWFCQRSIPVQGTGKQFFSFRFKVIFKKKKKDRLQTLSFNCRNFKY